MKAQDLFIGAWVMRGDITSEPMKVTEIIPYKDYVCMDCMGLAVADRFSHINPYPLTEDILRRNGFTDCDTTSLDLESGNQFWYLGEEGFISNSDLVVNFFRGGAGFLVRCGNNIMYYREKAVHHLQRFLFDNEIDKEIKL